MVVLATLGEAQDPALDPALREAVAAHAASWARSVAGEGLALVTDAAPAVLGDLLAGHDGPVMFVAPDVPRLDAALAQAALGDIAAGCIVSFAPATDATPFLLAFADRRPEALALLAGDRPRNALFADAMALGDEVGLLRSERRVVTPADARALALDPLVSADLRALAARAGAS
ncbi:MAG: hypothetical protein WKF96_08210 [Solirubrobacteraceae bacterium]